MTTAAQFLRSSIARLASMGCSIVVAFFMMPFLVRTLGDYWYGVWGVISGTVNYFYIFDLGLATAVVRFVARSLATGDDRETNATISAAFCVYLIISGVLIIVAFLLAMSATLFVREVHDLQLIRILIFVAGSEIALALPFNAFAGIPSAFLRYDLISLSRVTMMLLSAGLVFTYVARGYGLLALATIGFVCTQISNGLYFAISKRLFPELALKRHLVSRRRVKDLFSFSLWSLAIQVGVQLRGRIAPLVIVGFLGAQRVTHFLVGSRLVENAGSILASATNFSMPVFTRYDAEGRTEAMREVLLFLTKVHGILALLAAGGIFLLGRPFIQRWMGPEYIDAYMVSAILVVAFIPEFLAYPSTTVLFAMARHPYLAGLEVAEGVVNTSLSLLLVSRFDIAGVALATAVPIAFFRLFLLPRHVCGLVGLSLATFYRNLASGALFALLFFGVAHVVTHDMFAAPGYPAIFGVAAVIVGTYGFGAFMLLFSPRERELINSALPAPLRGFVLLLGRQSPNPDRP